MVEDQFSIDIEPMVLREGDTLIVHTGYFLDPEARAQFREAVLRDCKIPSVGMIFLPSECEVQIVHGPGWADINIEAMREVCNSVVTMLESTASLGSKEQADQWEYMRKCLAAAGFSWKEPD